MVTSDGVHHEDVEARCPRCGYDLRGVVQAWDDSCPLEGTCAECGLGFEWSKVLRPEFHEPQWCVEFAPRGARPFIGSCVKTMLRTLWPWGFWKRMNMALEVRWRRLAGYVGFVVAVLLVLYMAQQAAVAVQVRLLIERHLSLSARDFQIIVAEAQTHLTDIQALDFDDAEEQTIEYEARAGRIVTETLTEAERDERVQRIQQRLPRWKQLAKGATVNQPMWRAVAEAVFMPWSTSSQGSIGDPVMGTTMYPSPRELHGRLIEERLYQTAGQSDLHWSASLWILAGTCTGSYLALMPVLFVLLPFSRRKAKVRWKHVWRSAAYSLAIPAIGAAMMLVLVTLAFTIAPLQDRLLAWSRVLVFVPMLLLIAWWATAMGRYMKIPRGWFVAIVFAVLTVLLVGAGGFLLSELL